MPNVQNTHLSISLPGIDWRLIEMGVWMFGMEGSPFGAHFWGKVQRHIESSIEGKTENQIISISAKLEGWRTVRDVIKTWNSEVGNNFLKAMKKAEK